MNLKDAKVLVIDGVGLHVEMALRFLRDCKEVNYCVLEEGGTELGGKIGDGVDGLKRVCSPWNLVDKVDFIVCPDTGSAELVEYLKAHNYPVAGPGSAEILETDRMWSRRYQRSQEMPTQATKQIKGITALKDYLRDKKDMFVKVDNEYRCVSESFKHSDFKASEQRIKYIDAKVGPYSEQMGFVVEECIEGSEPGMDGITFDGELVFPTLAGYERKKKGYVTRVYNTWEEYPEPYREIHEGLAPELKKRKTKFFYSTELIIGKDRRPFLIDVTQRLASPCTFAVQLELIGNYTEVVYGLATGVRVVPKMTAKYGAGMPFESKEIEKDFVNIMFPKELRQWVKLSTACKVGSDYYAIPNTSGDPLGCVVAVGNTVEEAMSKVKERIKEVKGEGICYDEGGFDKIPDDITEGKRKGISF